MTYAARGLAIDKAALAEFMARRAPGRDKLSTARRETDEVVWRGGFAADGTTTGETIVGEIASRDMRPADYGAERTIPRPGHADFGQWIEMGRIPTGGGKNSGRLTAPLCAAGALCLQYLAERGIYISAGVSSVTLPSISEQSHLPSGVSSFPAKADAPRDRSTVSARRMLSSFFIAGLFLSTSLLLPCRAR